MLFHQVQVNIMVTMEQFVNKFYQWQRRNVSQHDPCGLWGCIAVAQSKYLYKSMSSAVIYLICIKTNIAINRRHLTGSGSTGFSWIRYICIMVKQWDSRSSMMVWVMFYWETLCPVIYV